MNLQIIENAFRTRSAEIQPNEAVQFKTYLTGTLSYTIAKLHEIAKQRPLHWNEKRPDFKSDTACNNWWDSTELGQEQIELESMKKRMENLRSACNSIIKLHEAEARNQM